MHHKEDPLLN